MRNVNTPPRRKSVINVFSTPPLRRSLFTRSTRKGMPPPEPSSFPDQARHNVATDFDDDSDDDENTLTATGDISMSYPYYVPGVAGALSPKPKSRHGTPNLRGHPQRPRPPVRRLVSVGAETYKFKNLTIKGGPTTPSSTLTPSKVPLPCTPSVFRAPAAHPGDVSVASTVSSCDSSFSIGSIPDEDIALSTPQSRFAEFMKSRDLTRSPKKRAQDSVADRNRKLDVLAQAASGVVTREVVRPPSRPLRGYANLPPRLPIPDWGKMDVDEL
ncbi:hypothetical protein C8R43DRAFT_1207408 [Mycena crocata]|nr:hypothetical protein C8R43DRAFT_1207408 [Mycena crocata]